MAPWGPRGFGSLRAQDLAHDADAEQAVARRLVPVARELLFVPGKTGTAEALAVLEDLPTRARAEILCGPESGVDLIEQLLERGFTVYDAAASSEHSLLVLDRRLGWRVPSWKPLTQAMSVAHRLLWTRIGQYSKQAGVVHEIHAENHLFTLRDRPIWINTAYRSLPFPPVGSAVQIVGLFSSIGGRVPMLHALRIDPAGSDETALPG